MLNEFVEAEATQEEEYINFECSVAETGDAYMKFENGVELLVSDLSHYYEISSEWLKFDETLDGIQTYKGILPRDSYAKLCVEAVENGR